MTAPPKLAHGDERSLVRRKTKQSRSSDVVWWKEVFDFFTKVMRDDVCSMMRRWIYLHNVEVSNTTIIFAAAP